MDRLKREKSWYIVQYGFTPEGKVRYIGPFKDHSAAIMMNRWLKYPGTIFDRQSKYELKGPNVISPDKAWECRFKDKPQGIQEGF